MLLRRKLTNLLTYLLDYLSLTHVDYRSKRYNGKIKTKNQLSSPDYRFRESIRWVVEGFVEKESLGEWKKNSRS